MGGHGLQICIIKLLGINFFAGPKKLQKRPFQSRGIFILLSFFVLIQKTKQKKSRRFKELFYFVKTADNSALHALFAFGKRTSI